MASNDLAVNTLHVALHRLPANIKRESHATRPSARAKTIVSCYKHTRTPNNNYGRMIQRPEPYISQIHDCINNPNGESPSGRYSGSEEIVEELHKVTKERNLINI
jgi:hypothetical protein